MARKASEARPVSPKGSKSQLGWNEPESFGLISRFRGLPVTMLRTLNQRMDDFLGKDYHPHLRYLDISREK